MTTVGRDHVVLVPGFAGFAAIGRLRYFLDAIPLLRRGSSAALCVHSFQGIPAAPVAARARRLAAWLAEERDRGAIQPSDRLHFVAHSTGGLDLRLLLGQLAAPLCDAVRSAQFLSTPHRGTNLARVAARTGALPRLLARTGFLALNSLGPEVWVSAAKLARRARRAQPPDLYDAVIDALADAGSLGSSFDRAAAREGFYDLMRWVNELASDAGAIDDLVPGATPWHGALPEHVAVRSIVTMARPAVGDRISLFVLLDRALRHDPPSTLGDACDLSLLDGGARRIEPGDHDGLVNCVSMVWPDAAHSVVVEADHADVIGHFAGGGYDLLSSAVVFDRRAFEALWADIARFAISAN